MTLGCDCRINQRLSITILKGHKCVQNNTEVIDFSRFYVLSNKLDLTNDNSNAIYKTNKIPIHEALARLEPALKGHCVHMYP